jgi:predicted DNA-binding protein
MQTLAGLISWYLPMPTLDNSPTSDATSENRASKRMSISLSAEASELLDFLAQSQGITQNEALRRAIWGEMSNRTETYVKAEIIAV